MHEPKGIPVPIGNRVVALWSYDLMADNREFLDSLDPEYFRVVLKALSAVTDKREEHLAATHVRVLRDQAAEMLFALLMAAIQAPNGVALWMGAYRNSELDDLLNCVNAGQPVLTTKGKKGFGWPDIVLEVTRSFQTANPSELDVFRDQHSEFWQRLAREFVDDVGRREFGCLKHGLRARPGGFSLTLTPESSLGVKDPEAKSIHLPGSRFGSSFQVPEQIKAGEPHYQLAKHHRNWSLDSFKVQIDLVVNSIQNTVSHLRQMNGHSAPASWRRPVCEEGNPFRDCWRTEGTVQNWRSKSGIDPNHLPTLDKHALRRLCEDGQTGQRCKPDEIPEN